MRIGLISLMNIVTTTRVLVVIGFLAVCVPTVVGESVYCAFEVKVTTPSGTPRPKVPVLLIRQNTTFSETATDANGLARLCDAPLQAVDIAVGVDVCGLVMVRNLHSMWPETKRVFVTFAENPCDHFTVPEYCQVLLRIQDEEGRPVVGARLDEKPLSRNSGSNSSDDLGRLFRLVKRYDKLEGIVRGGRGQQARVSVLCKDDVELKVILHER